MAAIKSLFVITSVHCFDGSRSKDKFDTSSRIVGKYDQLEKSKTAFNVKKETMHFIMAT